MDISPRLGILIMMNNYFHDVATAMLLASAVTLWVLYRLEPVERGNGAARFFLAGCRRLERLGIASLVWIVLGGIPRVIYYTRFEWANAAGKGQVPALIVKHLMVVALLSLGAFGWWKLRARIEEVRCSLAGQGA